MAMRERACHVIARGRVQGVFYRASTVQKAESLGISGWVRNRRDGTVEAVLSGTPDSVEQMLAWMATGPSAARVDGLEVNEYDASVDAGFGTRDTV